MTPKTTQKIVHWLRVAVIGMTLGLAVQFARAWVEPDTSPPGGNVAAPLHTGTTSQTKQGSLTVLGGIYSEGASYGAYGYETDTGTYGLLGYAGWGGYFNGGVYTNSSLQAVGNIVNSVPSQGWLGLTGDLPGYPSNVYPTLKTNGRYLFFSANNVYSGYWDGYDLHVNGTAYANGQALCQVNGTNCPPVSTNADTVDGYHVSVAGSANTLPTRNGSGYLIPENWTQLNGYYGLYSPNNGAHFYPNNGSYGSWRVAGSRNNWYGLEFDTAAGQTSLMVGAASQDWGSQITGFHNNSYGWLWRFDHSTLAVGNVPIARIPDIGSASVNYATYGRNVYDDGAYSGSAAWREPSSMYVYYSYYGRLVYNNGAYSGSGWTEPSDLGVRYADTAGSAGSLYNVGGFYAIPRGTTVLNVVYAYQYNCMSDINLKKDIKPIGNALDKVLSIKGVSFKWKDEKMGTGNQVGVIAQDVEKVLPEIVSKNEQGYEAVDYTKLSPLIIEAIKEMKSSNDLEINDLKQRIDDLESKEREKNTQINDLKRRMEIIEAR